MQRISRAPVLSATLRRGLVLDHLRTLQDLDEPPALGARQRAALDDADEVALVGVVALVVGVQRGRRAHDLLVAPVAAGDVDADGDRLVGLVGDDDALAHLRAAGAVLGRVRLAGPGSARAARRLRLRARGSGARAALRLRSRERSASRSSGGAAAPRLAAPAARRARGALALDFSRRLRAAGGCRGAASSAAGASASAARSSAGASSAAASAAVAAASVRLWSRVLGASRLVLVSSCRLIGHVRVDAALARDGQGAREVALGVAQAGGVLQLAGGVLEAQPEELAPRPSRCARAARRR